MSLLFLCSFARSLVRWRRTHQLVTQFVAISLQPTLNDTTSEMPSAGRTVRLHPQAVHVAKVTSIESNLLLQLLLFLKYRLTL